MDSLRILAVEDNPADFRLLTEYLGEDTSSHFEVVRAATLKEALARLLGEEFAAVLLDLNLPDAHGLEVLEKVVAVKRSPPVIVLTGSDSAESGLSALSKKAQDYLVKGKIDSDSLVRSIRYAIERNKAEESARQMSAELAKRAADIQSANEALQASRAAALNLMEDALEARNRAEQVGAELARVSDRLILAQQSAGAGTWDWDMLTGKLDWSPELFRLFGLDPAKTQASFDVWTRVMLPADRQIASDRIQQAIQNHTRLANEFRIVLPTGEERWINALGDTTYDDAGTPTRMSGICLDITDRKRAEEALLDGAVQKQSAQYARTLIEVSIDPLITISVDGKITDVNAAAIKATGVPREKLVGTDFSSYFTEPEKAREGYRRVFDEGFVTDYPLTIRHQDGRLMNVLYNASVYKDTHGKVAGVFAAARDVTAQKQAEAERGRYQESLRELAKRLASAEERERHRISTQIHDTVIQTLSLSNIKLGSVRKQLADAELADRAGEVSNARSLIEEAIKESRSLMAELTPPLLYELGLAPALQDLTERLQKLHGLPIRVRDDGRPKPIEKSIYGSLFEATRELIVNALKHAGPCTITVNLSRNDEYLCINVEDSGVGFIVPEDHNFIVRQDGGFGLFSIRERVDHLGGKLSIDSQPGKGTSATILVPLKNAP